MHFGKLVKETAYSRNLSAENLAVMLERSISDILALYETEDWKFSDVVAISEALCYDFGKYLGGKHNVNFLTKSSDQGEIVLVIKYQKGKEALVGPWINKMLQMAKSMGLELHW